jgi:hypothetical protein
MFNFPSGKPSTHKKSNKYQYNRKQRQAHTIQKNPQYQYTKEDYKTPTTNLDFTRRDLLGAVFYQDLVTLETLNQLYPALI